MMAVETAPAGTCATEDAVDVGVERDATTTMEAKLIVDGKEQMVMGEGNGPIDAFVAALTGAGLFEGKVADYSEHTMGTGSDATAVAYVEIDTGGRDTTWGVGMHESIVSASLRAIVSAVNTLRS